MIAVVVVVVVVVMRVRGSERREATAGSRRTRRVLRNDLCTWGLLATKMSAGGGSSVVINCGGVLPHSCCCCVIQTTIRRRGGNCGNGLEQHWVRQQAPRNAASDNCFASDRWSLLRGAIVGVITIVVVFARGSGGGWAPALSVAASVRFGVRSSRRLTQNGDER